MKKTISFIITTICLFMAQSVSAQFAVTSVDKLGVPGLELRQIIDLGNSTYVYATFTRTDSKTNNYQLNRKTCVMVDGLKYKIKNSVNMPIADEAEERELLLDNVGDKINFIMAFEKFPAKDGFDLLQSGSNDSYGIHIAKIDSSQILNTDRFLNTYSATIHGRYSDQGTNYVYTIRDNVSVTCRAVHMDNGWLESDDKMFYVDIVNNSDHGIKFDFEKVWVAGFKKKSDGSEEEKAMTKYTPDSYDNYLHQQDYYEARSRVGGMKDVGYQLKRESWNKDNSAWGKLGLEMLSAMANQMAENSIEEYMKNHPKEHPKALRTQSIRAGEAYHGYIASKAKKVDHYWIHIPIDGYDFKFHWK